MQVQKLVEMIRASAHTVFFGGAGVSTESGIPDFRSQGGLYRQQYPVPPEIMLSHDFFIEHPGEFYTFHRDRMVYPNVRPNAAHMALAGLEIMGLLDCVVTQNIDGLHQAAGSSRVFELHGSIHRNHCMRCRRAYSLMDIMAVSGVPRCGCGGIIKPDVVLYGENLPEEAWEGALHAIRHAELLLVGGTSLSVYPAAGLVNACPGKLVLINQSQTAYDDRAALLIRDKVGETLGQAFSMLSL